MQGVSVVDPAKPVMQDPDSGERVKEEEKSPLPVSVAVGVAAIVLSGGST